MRFTLLSILVSILIGGQAGPKTEEPPPLKLQSGDVVRIYTAVKISETSGVGLTVPPTVTGQTDANDTVPPQASSSSPDPYSGEFLVQSDGAIYGIGFGRLVVAGHTLAETQHLIRVSMKRLVHANEVFVTLGQQREQHVFMVGAGTGNGTVRLFAGLTLRQALARSPLDQNPDLIEAQVFRGGQEISKVNVRDILKGGDDLPLRADDVITLTPTSHLRVWVTGAVRSPGRILLPDNATPQEAVAAAGGIQPGANTVEAQASRTKDFKLVVHRGSEDLVLTAESTIGAQRQPLEEGDSIEVIAPKIDRVQVFGEVNRPGEVVTHEGTTIIGAIGAAGGATRDGSLTDVLLNRGGENQILNVSPQAKENDLGLELLDGDVIVVRDTTRVFYVFGSVARQGRIVIPEGKTFHLSDAIALSGGLLPQGTLRRMFVSHPEADGKMKVKQYNLDAFLKDGDLKNNPIIFPGDAILVGNQRPTTLEAASQILNSLVVAFTISRL